MSEYAPYGTITEYRPLDWQKMGLQQTRSGYGAKLTSSRIAILPDGKRRRVYVTCYSNAGTAWIIVNKKKLIIRDY